MRPPDRRKVYATKSVLHVLIGRDGRRAEQRASRDWMEAGKESDGLITIANCSMPRDKGSRLRDKIRSRRHTILKFAK